MAPENAAEATPVGPDILTPVGLGTIGIGRAPAIAGAGVLTEDENQLSDECRTLKASGYPHIYVMSDGERVTRITVMDGSEVRTAKGIGPGATEAEVRAAYPDVREEPHKYEAAPAKNLYWEPQGKDGNALRFEIGGDGKVSLIHAGVQPSLSYVEGCA